MTHKLSRTKKWKQKFSWKKCNSVTGWSKNCAINTFRLSMNLIPECGFYYVKGLTFCLENFLVKRSRFSLSDDETRNQLRFSFKVWFELKLDFEKGVSCVWKDSLFPLPNHPVIVEFQIKQHWLTVLDAIASNFLVQVVKNGSRRDVHLKYLLQTKQCFPHLLGNQIAFKEKDFGRIQHVEKSKK